MALALALALDLALGLALALALALVLDLALALALGLQGTFTRWYSQFFLKTILTDSIGPCSYENIKIRVP